MAEKISKGERKISKKKKDTETKIKIEIETESKNNQQQGRCLLRGARFGVCVFENWFYFSFFLLADGGGKVVRYKKCAHMKCYFSILCLCICAYWFVLRKKSNFYRKTSDKNSDKTKRHFCGIIMVTNCISSASNLLPSAVVRSIILYIGWPI